MRSLFETIIGKPGSTYAIVRGRNPYGEYVVTLYLFNLRTRLIIGTYYSDDLTDACMTALDMTKH